MTHSAKGIENLEYNDVESRIEASSDIVPSSEVGLWQLGMNGLAFNEAWAYKLVTNTIRDLDNEDEVAMSDLTDSVLKKHTQ